MRITKEDFGMLQKQTQIDDVNSTIYKVRIERTSHLLEKSDFSTLVLNPGPTLYYLTGLSFHLMERPIIGIFTPHQPVILIIPELEARKIETLPFPIQPFSYNDDPASWPNAFDRATDFIKVNGAIIGVEPTRFRFLELRLLGDAIQNARFVSAEDMISGLRMKKDDQEIRAMRKAVEIAQLAISSTLPFIEAGITERMLASELSIQLLRNGSSSDFPFNPIVSSGPNSANPHATPSDRPLHPGDLLVIDWGASYEGYLSDLTRTFAIQSIEPELMKIAEIVSEANAVGRSVAKPGIPAKEVDRAARSVIEKAGYGQFFSHRTGHGLGLEGHEAPYMHSASEIILEPGMTFTIEPGIYLPGRGGVRIEDDVVITANGSESLSNLPRNLQIL